MRKTGCHRYSEDDTFFYACIFKPAVLVHFYAAANTLGEVFRVLRPGGRLQIADMVRVPSTGDAVCCSGEESWADCVTGTLDPDVLLSMLKATGFHNVELTKFTGYKTAASAVGALIKAVKPR